MSCKPYALVALWTDTIPPPGNQTKAHLLMRDKFEQNQLTVSQETVDIQMAALPATSPSNPMPHVSDPHHMAQNSSSTLDLDPSAYPEGPGSPEIINALGSNSTGVAGSPVDQSTKEAPNTTKSLGTKGQWSIKSWAGTPKSNLSFRSQREKNLAKRYKEYKYKYIDVVCKYSLYR